MEALIEVSMIRPSLEGLPRVAVPAPFTLRPYRAGDRETWVDIQQQADGHHRITPALFDREFGGESGLDERLLASRQLFLCEGTGDGEAVGTATAWFNPAYHGRDHGRIHWVAVRPRLQGQGLGKALVSALCQRFTELGHERAYLTTETVRVPAIRMYLGFGFVPELKDDRDRRAWRALRDQGLRLPPAIERSLGDA